MYELKKGVLVMKTPNENDAKMYEKAGWCLVSKEETEEETNTEEIKEQTEETKSEEINNKNKIKGKNIGK